MAAVTASMVKELRERTGLGMMECKKALVAAEGDIERAIDDLRKSGQAKAAKKAGRTAAEGVVMVATSEDRKRAVMVEINSETDFVARDDNFLGFANKVAQAALDADEVDAAKIVALSLEDGSTVEQARESLVQKIGENIQVRRAVRLNATDAKDVCMHVAAVAPMVVNSENVPEDVLEKEREIIRAQPDMEGKPAEIVEKMVGGRINKFLKEVSLTDQPFVKDPNTTVGQLVKDAGAEVLAFERLVVGEGIEKEEVDFAAEVMAQAKG